MHFGNRGSVQELLQRGGLVEGAQADMFGLYVVQVGSDLEIMLFGGLNLVKR
jgi:hypothetical protein